MLRVDCDIRSDDQLASLLPRKDLVYMYHLNCDYRHPVHLNTQYGIQSVHVTLNNSSYCNFIGCKGTTFVHHNLQ